MRRAIFILAILAGVLAATALFEADIRLSVSDLAINSDNPQYKYVGKGIAEMIAVELRKSRDITLIEREKRTVLVEEMEFSLSDLADSTTRSRSAACWPPATWFSGRSSIWERSC